jgi:hypothetical protein
VHKGSTSQRKVIRTVGGATSLADFVDRYRILPLPIDDCFVVDLAAWREQLARCAVDEKERVNSIGGLRSDSLDSGPLGLVGAMTRSNADQPSITMNYSPLVATALNSGVQFAGGWTEANPATTSTTVP